MFHNYLGKSLFSSALICCDKDGVGGGGGGGGSTGGFFSFGQAVRVATNALSIANRTNRAKILCFVNCVFISNSYVY